MVNENECRAAGLDPKDVERIAKNLTRWCNEAEKLGITVFGGSGGGDLRCRKDLNHRALILARLTSNFDGGAGDCIPDENGLLRGE